ncbi:Pho8 protein [Candida orthopsilosis Co 90-125]|uniref:Alkaline phosphatase n=1 Tax=Candida orthopsilosis (strain 90-125) TaxID=1136231 RepID=H8WWK7_CANO9|nr:Pho8 protein [Candida orthopsilosis Co 90-125]CCG20831.1 Pho8 protein [Candida orthopsilosis Co 90-125]
MTNRGERSALLGGDSLIYNNKPKSNFKKNISYILNVVTIITIAILLFRHPSKSENKPKVPSVDPHGKKNIIMMVTDGMGPASLSAARSFRQLRDKLPIDDVLVIDKYLIGSSRTRSSSSLITDSAAGATAFSCGLKSYNGAIGVDSEKTPCGTILEALKLQGYMTGLVVTTRITDATPAAFSSHVDYRFQEDLIAQHQLGEYPFGRAVDLILGGGRCHFVPTANGGCRADKRDLIKEAVNNGWSYAGDRKQFDQLNGGKNVSLPLLGLLANHDIPYDIDRSSKEFPSLAEQVKVALTALQEATRDSDQGFFLLVEGSRIDHAGHHNDPAAQVREVLAYDDAFKEVIDFIDSTDVETVAISTSDHETGGLVTARQVTESYPDYLWYPQVLLNSSHSGEHLARKIYSQKVKSGTKFTEYIKQEILEKDMGITDYTEDEVKQISLKSSQPEALLYFLNNMISFRAQIGWTTHGHSAVDVNIYAHTNSFPLLNKLKSRKAYDGLTGNHENIEIGAFMETVTGSNLNQITEMIKKTIHSPHHGKSDLSRDEFHANAIPSL